MSGVSIDTAPTPSPVSDDISDIRLALRGGNEFAARAQALEAKKVEIASAASRLELARAEHDAAFARLSIGNDVAAALANAKKFEAAMTAAYELASRVEKAVQARSDEMIKATAASCAAEQQAAQADRARAGEVLAAANASMAELQAKSDAADQRGRDAEQAQVALQGKLDRLNAVLAEFIADLDEASS